MLTRCPMCGTRLRDTSHGKKGFLGVLPAPPTGELVCPHDCARREGERQGARDLVSELRSAVDGDVDGGI